MFSGGGLAEFELQAFLRDHTAQEDVQVEVIASDTLSESGGGNLPVMPFVKYVSSLLLGEPEATQSADLEPLHVYGTGIRLITRAQGFGTQATFTTSHDTTFITPFPGAPEIEGRAWVEGLKFEFTPLMEDSDGDGLFDEWETVGVKNCHGDVVLDLPGFCATPDHKDIFVELDWLPGAGIPPKREELAAVKDVFAKAPVDAGGVDNPDGEPGIRLWIDTGGLPAEPPKEDGVFGMSCFDGIDNAHNDGIDAQDPDCQTLAEDGHAHPESCFDGMDNGDNDGIDAQDPDCLVADNLGGGNGIDLADVPNGSYVPRLAGDADDNGKKDFFEVKAKNFDIAARRYVFHYAISGPPHNREGDGGSGSCADGVDNDNDGFEDEDDLEDCANRSQAILGGATSSS